MSNNPPCPHCGAEIPADAPQGLCPRCLLEESLDGESPGRRGDGPIPADQSPVVRGPVGAGGTMTGPGTFQDSNEPASLAATADSMSQVLVRDIEVSGHSPVVGPSSPQRPDPRGDAAVRYQIFGEIARGGMGAVLKGRDAILGRDLAIKVLLEEHRDKPELVRRFLEEAQIGGQLQHPGVLPVYELGSFADARPYFTMKLVKGRTLATLLEARRDPTEDLPRFLAIFEQVCQTMAYAHARGVIHRDLKPSNVMVGAFGEVQVMDWGLAKVRARQGGDDAAGSAEADRSVIRTVRSDSDADASQAGSVLGTPAYMAPEQANGESDGIDARVDVFGLGALLCQVLTGSPAYTGRSRREVLRKAALGDLADARSRLDGCGADGELVALAKGCLSAEPQDRPGEAGVVASAMTAYRAGVQQRLRAAELAQVEAEARAEREGAVAAQERRARRLTAALAASLVLTVAVVAAGWRWVEQDRATRASALADRVGRALQEATRLRGRAQRSATGELSVWAEAVAAARHAREFLGDGGDASLRRQVDGLLTTLLAEEAAALEAAHDAAADRRLLDRLTDVRGAREDDAYGSARDADYARAFRDYGMDLDVLTPAQAGARLKARPPAVALALVAELDDWAALRRGLRDDPIGARRLTEAAQVADPNPWRGRLRVALTRVDRAGRAEALRTLARTASIEELPVASLNLLGQALLSVGDADLGTDVLRHAQRRAPGDVWVNFDLARALEQSGRTSEAIRYYTVVRALQPEAGHDLARSLAETGRSDEAIAIFRDLIRLRPKLGRHHYGLGQAMRGCGRDREADDAFDAAIGVFRQAIRLKPGDTANHIDLGNSLAARGEVDAAIAEYREAIRLNPDEVVALANLGRILDATGAADAAIAALRAAIRLKPDYAAAHNILGVVLNDQLGDPDGAIAEFQTVLHLQPNNAAAHNNLGVALEAKGEADAAIASYREAIRLKPDHDAARANLDAALAGRRGASEDAMAEFRRALRPKPDLAEAHVCLGIMRRQRGRFTRARDSFERARGLVLKDSSLRRVIEGFLRETERLARLEGRLPAILRGDYRPRDDAERLDCARLCDARGLDAASADLYQEVFEARPDLADDLRSSHRYNAACAAALAGGGRAKDDPPTDETARARFRRQALSWLQADLAAWSRRLEGGPEPGVEVRETLGRWKVDPDLAGLRDEAGLASLPDDERQRCRALWSGVDAMMGKVGADGTP